MIGQLKQVAKVITDANATRPSLLNESIHGFLAAWTVTVYAFMFGTAVVWIGQLAHQYLRARARYRETGRIE